MDQSLKARILLGLSIRAHDGLLSEAELCVLREFYCDAQAESLQAFHQVVEEFFSSDAVLEDLLEAADYSEEALRIAKLAASSDGLDLRENLALEKCEQILKRRDVEVNSVAD